MKKNLEGVRLELNSLNIEIAKRIEKRFLLMEEVLRCKKEERASLFDEARENEMFKSLESEFSSSKVYRQVQNSMKTIFKESLKYLKDISIK